MRTHPFTSIALRTGALALLACANGCIPDQAAYWAFPIATSDGQPREAAVVEVPVSWLRNRLKDGYDPGHLAFYGQGRDPLPMQFVDRDADGSMDVVLVELDLLGGRDQNQRLTVICPGPAAPRAPVRDVVDAGVLLEERWAPPDR